MTVDVDALQMLEATETASLQPCACTAGDFTCIVTYLMPS